MKLQNLIHILILAATSVSLALGDDFKTIAGKEYKDATVTRVEPDGILVKYKSGISKLYFVELPKEVQERFHYDPQQATAYSAGQAANYAVYQDQQQKQQQDSQHQREAIAAQSAQLQAAYNSSQSLQDRYLVLQQEENALLQQIGEAQKPGPGYWGGYNHRKLLHHPNSEQSQIPLLKSRLQEVQREKNEVREQLNKAQR